MRSIFATAAIFILSLFFPQDRQSDRRNPDSYPVTDSMLLAQLHKNRPAILNGQFSWPKEKATFVSKSGKEALVFSLYTDLHREQTYLFYTGEIPQLVLSRMELNYRNGDLIDDDSLKQAIISAGLSFADTISDSYFKSNFGFSLGASLNSVEKFYGIPHEAKQLGSHLLLHWSFQGLDMLQNAKPPIKPNPYRKFYGWGFDVSIEFNGKKAIAVVFEEGIP